MSVITSNGAAAVKVYDKLDIGAGAKREDGWLTMDISPVHSPDFQHDLTQFPWPFRDGQFSEVRAWHILEHIERRYLIPVMNEMHRILKSGGMASIEVPVFPYWTAIADPTHLSFFVPQTFAYFCTFDSYRKAMHGARAADYDEQRELYGAKTWICQKGMRDGMGSILQVELVKP